ncbi:hypothetical protein M758_1G037600 [Ceratodon purpureus]|nr:hypothetical protein M758_1G037600 [Ceratodon purpureus]
MARLSSVDPDVDQYTPAAPSAQPSRTPPMAKALQFWQHLVHILFNLVLQLLVSVIPETMITGTFYSFVYVERLARVLIARMVSLVKLGTGRALRWAGCEHRTLAHSTTSCDPSRISWNLKALLKERLIMFTRMIIVSWVNIKVMLKVMIQLLFMFNVFKSFFEASMWNIVYKTKAKNPTIQQPGALLHLNQELRDIIFAKLPMVDVIRLQAVCKDFDKVKTNDTFKVARKMKEGSFGPNVFYLENNTTYMTWQWMSYDFICQQWRKMPSFSSLPLPDIELFKDFFVAGGGGMFCIDVGKDVIEELIVYQPLTKQKKRLPRLIHRRRPVLIHILVEEISNSYKIIVAGCSTNGSENLSRKTEVYDSCTRCWNESGDIPGPEFALNDYQTGVYVKKLKTLFCVGFLPEDKGRGILAYNVEKGIWIKSILCQLPQSFLYNNIQISAQIMISQLLEYNNEIFLFSEEESGQEVTHSIHKLQEFEHFGGIDDDGNNIYQAEITWERVLCESRNGTRGLLTYPEFECLAYGKDKFCIFNTIERTGALYDIHFQSGVYTFNKQEMPLFPRLKEDSLTFHTLNPMGYVFDLTFKISI